LANRSIESAEKYNSSIETLKPESLASLFYRGCYNLFRCKEYLLYCSTNNIYTSYNSSSTSRFPQIYFTNLPLNSTLSFYPTPKISSSTPNYSFNSSSWSLSSNKRLWNLNNPLFSSFHSLDLVFSDIATLKYSKPQPQQQQQQQQQQLQNSTKKPTSNQFTAVLSFSDNPVALKFQKS